jgi:hypothetical protein
VTTTGEEPRTHQPQAARNSLRWRDTLRCRIVVGFEYEGYVWHSAATMATNVCTVAACSAEATESSSNPSCGESPMPLILIAITVSAKHTRASFQYLVS